MPATAGRQRPGRFPGKHTLASRLSARSAVQRKAAAMSEKQPARTSDDNKNGMKHQNQTDRVIARPRAQ